ncbi:acetylserotonin O-methyltransferase [Streptomyces sp. MST-110588]|uniref:acetylserotonin O-methyltransferase n=1 Tax=Streptomyces sp. MST-110588 TaxID=2833628 RepID=UPI001F5E170A|nr:acetylserotonin O-methyltransferase [Streptomyces sp. MST-110588]UNO40758.1 methyltransferase domain-containing protein [Streptomyces sp. MST-110588]
MDSTTGTALTASATDVKRLSNAFCHAKLLLTAGELGLFEDLEQHGPSTQEELSARVGLHARAARDFLHGLVLLGLLDLEGDRYRNSRAASATLVPGAPDYIGGFLHRANHMLYPAWAKLTDAVTSGRPQTAGAKDAGAFLRMLGDPAQRGQYLQMMDSANGLVAPHLAEAYDWRQVGDVLDVGGCRGNLVSQLLLRFPGLKASVYDLAPLAGAFAEHTERLGVADRATFHAGDFFAETPLPVTADVVVMGHVLHNWSPEQRAYLVKKAYAAVRPGGALLIYDAVLPEEPADLARTLVSLNMLLVTEGGSEYTAAECGRWLSEAGCQDVSTRPLGPTDTLIIGRR